MGYRAGGARHAAGAAVARPGAVADEEGASKERRSVMLPILQLRFGCRFVFWIRGRFNLVASGDVCGLHGTEYYSGDDIIIIISRIAINHLWRY